MRTAPLFLLAASLHHCPTRLTGHSTSVARLCTLPLGSNEPPTTDAGAGMARMSASTSIVLPMPMVSAVNVENNANAVLAERGEGNNRYPNIYL